MCKQQWFCSEISSNSCFSQFFFSSLVSPFFTSEIHNSDAEVYVVVVFSCITAFVICVANPGVRQDRPLHT